MAAIKAFSFPFISRSSNAETDAGTSTGAAGDDVVGYAGCPPAGRAGSVEAAFRDVSGFEYETALPDFSAAISSSRDVAASRLYIK